MFNVTNLMVILAIIATVVQLVEELLGAGTGEQKKAAVVAAITQLLTELKIGLPAIITGNLGIIIDVVVGIYNAVGTFKKTAK